MSFNGLQGWCGLAVYLIGLMACTGEDNQRCDPIRGTGCPSGLYCSLSLAGVPTCVPVDVTAAQEGERCQSHDATRLESELEWPVCGPALACVSEQGISRCLRFCNPENSTIDDDCPIDQPTTIAVDGEEARLNYASYSTCRLTPVGRPGLGLCGLPCRLGLFAEAAGCPAETRCGLPIAAPTATCMLNGVRNEGQECGPACPCREPLVCVPDQRGAACRSVQRTDNTCPDELIALDIPNTADPLPPYDGDSTTGTGSPYVACVPCRDLGMGGPTVCPSFEGCADDGGGPAELDEADLVAVVVGIQLVGFGDVRAVMDVQQDDSGAWRWKTSQNQVEPGLWVGGQPPSEATCIVATADGLVASDECGGPMICMPQARPVCDGDG